MEIPTAEDWNWGTFKNPYDLIHTDYAKKQFLGKPAEQAKEFYLNAPLEGMANICYMPPIPFRYYMLAFAEFLISPELVAQGRQFNSEAISGASTFLQAVERMIREYPDFIVPIMDDLLPVAVYISENEDFFDPSGNFYGNIPDIVRDIESMYQQQKQGSKDTET